LASGDVGNLAVKISLDSTGFQNGIGGINTQMRVVQSEFKLASAQLGEFGTSTEQLGLKSNSLNQQIDLQKQKVTALEQAFQQSAEKKGLDAKATQDLQIKLNNAKTALAGMDSELSQTTRLLKEAATHEEEMGRSSDTTGSKLQGLKTAFGTVGLAAGAFLASAVKSATDAQKSTGILTNLLEDQGLSATNAGKDIKEFTTAITKMSAFSAGDAKAALQTLTEKGIDASKALGMEGTLANVAAGRNSSLSDAANLVADAYHGKAKALVTLGILSKAEVKQLGNSETAAMTMATVQKRLNERFAGSAQTELGSYSGQMKQMENQMNSAKTAIGTALLPILAQFATAMEKVIIPIADFIKQNPNFTAAVLTITALLGTLVGGASAVNTLAAAFGPLSTVLSTAGISMGSLVLPVIGVVAAIALVAFAGYELYKNWDTIKLKAQELWTSLKQTFSNLGSYLTTTWNGIKVVTETTWNGIKTYLSSIWTGISTFFTTLWTGMKTTTETIWNGIKVFLVTIWTGIVAGVTAIATPFINGILTLWNSMVSGIKLVMEGYKLYLTGIWNVIKNVVLGAVLLILDLVTGNFTKLKTDATAIFNNLKAAFGQIWAGIKLIFTGSLQAISGLLTVEWNAIKTITETVWNGLKQFLANLWGTIKSTATGAWNGFKASVSSIISATTSAIRSTWESILSWFTTLPSRLRGYATTMFGSMRDGVNSVVPQIRSAVVNGLEGAWAYIRNLPSAAAQWGGDIVRGLMNGIRSMIGSVGSMAGNLADTIKNKIRGALGIASPSKVMMEVGKYTGQGLAIGMEGQIGEVSSMAQRMANGITGINGSMPDIRSANSMNGGASITNITNSSSPQIHVAQLVVREEADIQKISQQLFRLQQGRLRSLGVNA
jgi:phage-related minor tail protein